MTMWSAHRSQREQTLLFISAFFNPPGYLVSSAISAVWGGCVSLQPNDLKGRFHNSEERCLSSWLKRQQMLGFSPSIRYLYKQLLAFSCVCYPSNVFFSPVAEKKRNKCTWLWITMLWDSHCKFLDRSFVPFFNYTGLVPAMVSSTSFIQQPLSNQYVCRGRNTVSQVRELLLPIAGHSFLSALSKVTFRPLMKKWLHDDICEVHNHTVCSALKNSPLFACNTKPIAKSSICS